MIKVAKLTVAAWGITAAGLSGGLGVVGMSAAVAHADKCFMGADVSTPDHLNAGVACHKDPDNIAYDAVKDKNKLAPPKNYVDDNDVLVWLPTQDWGSILGHTH